MAPRFSGRKARTLRDQQHLSVEDVAFAVGRSVRTVYHYEAGSVDPPAHVVARLAEVFGCELSELFEEADRASA